MIRPMFGLVGRGGGVRVGNGVGNPRSEIRIVETSSGLAGSSRQSPIRRTRRSNPTGNRNRVASLRREKIRRRDM